ncbi:MAG: tRNA uridine(34) 5-carboxymethylaminomethyl modification radical SAM/GNAT enzyme Elp3 [Methanobrevibacter sp.]|jgi:elongator complex protein 3|nr:tRNA uridine(34) 5-carboxymethylaminomethyl modification radical SAM/GNAT enzyme Elp3 [Candidatus Methanovirga procula]
METPCRLLIEDILNGKIKTRIDLEKSKRIVCNEFKLEKFMTNSQILEYAKEDEKKDIYNILQKKPTRTISGVAIVAVMCNPHKCPHGRCLYCPESNVAPPSYTGEEPAALRARIFNFDPYKQTYQRLKQLDKIGHPIDKVELIVMGGTFPSRDLCYQEWFISKCLKAMNDYQQPFKNEKSEIFLNSHASHENKRLIKTTSESHYPPFKGGKSEISLSSMDTQNKKIYPPNDYVLLEDVQKLNESSAIRCVGMTFETRPDYCKIEDVNRMLTMGVTRVELGVQTTYDFVYRKIKRGHTVADVIDSTRILKDSGIKVGMHLMPGLLSNPEMDMRIFKRIFNDDNFKPDMLKIYPALVTKGSELHKLWMEGKYQPYTTEEAVDLIVKIKKILPKWVRTMRIQRDIPSKLIEAGVKKSNLGELVYNRIKEENIKCKCIRCREIGHNRDNLGDLTINDFKLFKESYKASNGTEIFLSYEDQKEEFLAGFLRLRLSSKDSHRIEINDKTAIIRELHVYGNMMKIGDKNLDIGQHRGYGEKLLSKAEEIAISNGKEKIAIISGIGARNYYRKFGYNLEGPYMVKSLTK